MVLVSFFSISARGAKFSDRTKSLFKNIKEKIKKEIDSETDSRPSTPREIGQVRDLMIWANDIIMIYDF